jgi:formylglycine-generating enzyme required for sulfatase activity
MSDTTKDQTSKEKTGPKSTRKMPIISKGMIINDRYEIKNKLGEGAFGYVYLAKDLKLDVEKAIKICGYTEDADVMIAELKKEAQNQAKIRHPNIVHLNDFDHSGRFLLLDMDYIDGMTLADKLNSTIPKGDKYQYALQIALALEAAHYKNIIHHDVKPANIMIDEHNNARLTDFGISEVVDPVHHQNGASGSIPYMSPEKLYKKESSFQTDIFSYGVLLHELFHGKRPFKKNEKGLLDYKLPKSLQRSKHPLDNLIKQCLNNTPESRPRSFSSIVEKIKELQFEANKPPIKVIKEYIEKKVKIRSISYDTKRDFAMLLLAMILLFFAGPYYLQSLDRLMQAGKKVIIDYSSSAGFINGEYKGISPIREEMEENDHFQMINPTTGLKLDGFYEGENFLRFRQVGNKIYLNNEIYGQIINSLSDLPLDPNIKFLHTNIDIPVSQLRALKNQNLSISLGEDFPNKSLFKLPPTTKYLRITNPEFSDLRNIYFLNQLRGLDLSGNKNIDLSYLEMFKKLQHLNLSDTGITNLDSLTKLKDLRTLNLSHNLLDDISGVDKLRKLESLNLDDNFDVESLTELNYLNKLEHASLDKLPLVDNLQKNKIKQLTRNNKARNRKIREKQIIPSGFWLDKLIVFIVFIISSLIILLLIRLLKAKTPKLNLTEDEMLPNGQKSYTNEIKVIKTMLDKHQLVTPEKNNALRTITDLLRKDPKNENLKIQNKLVFAEIKKKIKQHQKRYEVEPVYLLANTAKNIQLNTEMNTFAIRSRKKLISRAKEKFIPIKGGSFDMGDFTNDMQNIALPLHYVELDDFFMTETTVTNRQFCEFLNRYGNIQDQGVYAINLNSPYCQIVSKRNKYVPKEPYEDFPVIEVSWYGAMRYCKWRNGRLPTEAEWEYAARNGGKKLIFSTGNRPSLKKSNFLLDKDDDRWHSLVSVKAYKPNKLGLYQMSGNLLEWCYDYFDPKFYDEDVSKNPSGPKNGSTRVVRGGGWCFPKERMATFYRGSAREISRTNFIGFRVVREK